MKVRLETSEEKVRRIPEARECFRIDKRDVVYMRLPDTIRKHLHETLGDRFFYGISLSGGNLYHFETNRHHFVLLRPVGGELVMEEVD